MNDKILKTPEAANYLGVSIHWLRTLVRRKQITPLGLSGWPYRFSQRELDRYHATKRKVGGQPKIEKRLSDYIRECEPGTALSPPKLRAALFPGVQPAVVTRTLHRLAEQGLVEHNKKPARYSRWIVLEIQP